MHGAADLAWIDMNGVSGGVAPGTETPVGREHEDRLRSLAVNDEAVLDALKSRVWRG
jgi:hypothetical protein